MMGKTPRIGLLGWPVAHSVSPAMQNAAFQALGLPWRYELLPTPPAELAATLAGLAGQGFRGANVTIPHKETIMAYLGGVEAVAQAIGAVNTLLQRDGAWLGTNTDAAGFLAALRQAGFQAAGRRALVLGAGGAARAVVYALGQAGCTCLVYNRTVERARCLVESLPSPDASGPPAAAGALGKAGASGAAEGPGQAGPMGDVEVPAGTGATAKAAVVDSLAGLNPDSLDLLVNATPVGQWPQTGRSPWPEALALPSHWTVFDLVYNPVRTRLLARARAAGARPVGGLEMLVHQGALSHRLWTGREAPLEVMRSAARRAVGGEEG
jgi:shikimate dehydrogenase